MSGDLGTEDGRDALTVYSWRASSLVQRLKVPTKEPVRALAACPPEERGLPALVAIVGSEVWAGAVARDAARNRCIVGPPMQQLPLVLPRRLEALSAHLAATEDIFGDWQLARRAPLTKLFPDDEADLVTGAGAHLVPFAGDFAGGVLALDTSAADVENAHVVAFDSGGGITVLGESFDDFLALLASEIPDALEDCWVAEGDLGPWIRSTGIEPHRSASVRLVELGELTRRFWLKWTASLREVACQLRPGETSDLELVLGERIGDVSLGMRREALDARFGTPSVPSWGRSERGATAFYPGLPTVVLLDAAEEKVLGVTLYNGRHRAVTADAFDPMFMRLHDAEAQLGSLGVAFAREPSSLVVPELRTSFSLAGARGSGGGDPWIESIALTLA